MPRTSSVMTTEHPSSCLFCDMAQGRIRPNVVFENDRLMAFLDICPIRRGHVQIIPRAHFIYFDDLPSSLACEIVALGQKIARAQKRLYKVDRAAFLFTGGDIPHVHAHVVPMVEKTDITSRRYIREETLTFASTPRASTEELQAVAVELTRELEK
jgi:histidine triad (HIT) family protein